MLKRQMLILEKSKTWLKKNNKEELEEKILNIQKIDLQRWLIALVFSEEIANSIW